MSDQKIAKALSSSLSLTFKAADNRRVLSTFGLPVEWAAQARDEFHDGDLTWLIYSDTDDLGSFLIGWIRHGGTTVVPNVKHSRATVRADQQLIRRTFS